MNLVAAFRPNTDEAIAIAAGRVSSVAPQQFSNKRAYAATFAAMLAIRCAGVFTGVLSARLLGPTGRGELAVIIFLPVLLVPIAEFELPRSIAYAVSKQAEEPEELEELVATGFWLAILLGAIQTIILMVTLPLFLSAENLHLLSTARWFAIYLPAVNITLFLTGIDQGRGYLGRFAIFQALPGIVYLVAAIFAWWIRVISPAGFALGILSAAVITAALRVILDWRSILHSRPRWRIACSLLRRGMSFYIPAVAGFVLMRADTFLIVRLTAAQAIGLYAVAQAIATGQIGAVGPFVQVVFAAVAREVEQEKALQTLARHFRLAQLVVISVGLVTAGLTPWVIPFLFGAKYSEATTATYLLITASVFWGMSQVLEQGLRAASYPRPGIVSNLLGLVVLFSLGIPSCVRFGISGMAASLAIAEFTNLAALVTFCMVMLKMPLRLLWAFEPGTLRELAISARLIVDKSSPPQWAPFRLLLFLSGSRHGSAPPV